jgi:hypothetical protein
MALVESSGYRICLAAMLAMVFFCVTDAVAGDVFEVKTYQDSGSGGWTDKTSDYAFVAELDGCRIQWNALEEKSGKRWLVVRRNCKLAFSEQSPMHRAILSRINARWPIGTFKYINWGSLCTNEDWSWCLPIAVASLSSKEYIEHSKKYKREDIVSSNHIFIKLANETNAYKELADILREFGVTIRLKTVQKVFSMKLREVPFYDRMKSLNIRGNPRVMYDVGEAYFYIDNHSLYNVSYPKKIIL